MNDLFRGADETALDAALALLGAGEKALVRLYAEGRIIALTDKAERILELTPLHTIYEALAPQHSLVLQEALERREACSFPECFLGMQVYDVSAVPTDEGAFLLIEPRGRQTLLDAKIQQDVRNSLQGILSLTKRLEEDDPKRYERVTKRVCRIERILKHAELLQQAQGRPQMSRNDLTEICMRVVNLFEKAGGPPVEVRAPQSLEVTCDASLIMRALLNLLTNAAATTRIWLTLSYQEGVIPCSDGTCMITVEDNGKGLPPEELQMLYNSWRETVDYQRFPIVLEGETRPGTGLPLVLLIAEYHDGRLLFEEREEGGARFRFSFPDRMVTDVFGVECWREPEDMDVIKSELSVLEDRD